MFNAITNVGRRRNPTGFTVSQFLLPLASTALLVTMANGAFGGEGASKVPDIVWKAMQQPEPMTVFEPQAPSGQKAEQDLLPHEREPEAVQFDDQGRVLLEIHSASAITQDEVAAIQRLGAAVVLSTLDTKAPEGYNVIEAWVPGDALPHLEALSWVVVVRPVHRLPPDAGAYESEGVALHASDEVQEAGFDGTGLSVGVISDGVSNLTLAQASGDLPANVNVLDAGSGDEGTAMLEIIHDLAPGANLVFHGTGSGPIEHISAQNNLVSAGIDILSEDIAFDAEPAFQKGVVATNGDEIAAAGVSVHSSAGNRGTQHAARVVATGTGAPPEGHTGSFVACPSDLANVVDIDPGPGNAFDVRLSGAFLITLQWSEPRAIFPTGGAGGFTDLNLYVVTQDAAGNTTCQLSSNNVQGPAGSGDTIEQIAGSAAGTVNAKIVVTVASTGEAVAPPTIDLRWRGSATAIDQPTREGSLNPDANYTGQATSAAAADASVSTDALTVPLQNFSSGGPVDLALTTVCPGNTYPCPGSALAGSGSSRTAPNWTAADGVQVTGVGDFGSGTCPAANPGDCRFFGTSASAPHAAACDALVRAAAGVPLTVAEVNARLADGAVDRGPAGTDTAWGAGVLDCAVSAMVLPPVDGQPDLAITKQAHPTPARVGRNLAYELTVANQGKGEATRVVVRDWLPAGVRLASLPKRCRLVGPKVDCSAGRTARCLREQKVRCWLGSLAVGAEARLKLVVRPTKEGVLVNRAKVQAAEADLNPADNSVTVRTRVKHCGGCR